MDQKPNKLRKLLKEQEPSTVLKILGGSLAFVTGIAFAYAIYKTFGGD